MKKTFCLLVAASFALTGCNLLPNFSEAPKSVPVAPAVPADDEIAVPVFKPTKSIAACNREIESIEKELETLRMRQNELTAKRDIMRAEQDSKLFADNVEYERLQKEMNLSEKKLTEELASAEAERTRCETELALLRAQDAVAIHEKSLELTAIETEKKSIEIQSKELEAYYAAPARLIEQQAEIAKNITNTQPNYAENPYNATTGTLYISDRRVELDGLLTGDLAKSVCEQISFYNQRNDKLPIFVVITTCPGGSVRAGLLVENAIKASTAPVYVVVKGAAGGVGSYIVTTAERSFAYENAMIRQNEAFAQFNDRSNAMYMREDMQLIEYWVKTLGTPIAEKMGKTLEEYKELLYAKNSLGNWSENAVEAQKLGWVGKVVSRVEESSIVMLEVPQIGKVNPSKSNPKTKLEPDKKSRSTTTLPLLRDPSDCWWIYDPNGVYKY